MMLTKAAGLLKAKSAANNEPKWYVQAFRSKPLMYGLVITAIGAIIYYFGSQAQKKKLTLDQVDTSKLPSNKDKIENISKEELTKIVADCRWLFDNISAAPGVIVPKNKLFERLLALSDYELGLINNDYNNQYAETDTNLYNEIKDDYWYSYDEDLQQKVLTRLKAIGAGKTKF